MKILFFDCFSGISGDMALGALLDLYPENYAYLIAQLETLNIIGWRIEHSRRDKNGINANYIKVVLENNHGCEHDHEHRDYTDILKIIDGSEITPGAKKLAKNIFRRLAEAEAKVHGSDIENVTFHEVGAVDSIIDITGAAILLDLLISRYKIEKICCSAINDGSGFTQCQHGKIPVPVPAVVEIFAKTGVTTRRLDIPSELVTPTGAAIIAEIAQSYGVMPEMKILKTGYGAGTRDLEIPNVVRVILGETEKIKMFRNPTRHCGLDPQSHGIPYQVRNDREDFITIIETNIDDCSPEIIAYTMEKLFESGANDVFFTPVYMKKNRPAVKLTVLCKSAPDEINKMTGIIFAETTTIGLRLREERRICLERGQEVVNTVYGDLKVKVISGLDGEKKIIPEYEDAKKLAEQSGVPLYKIYESVE